MKFNKLDKAIILATLLLTALLSGQAVMAEDSVTEKAADQVVGEVVFVAGQAQATSSAGTEPLAKGDAIAVSDLLSTGEAGYLHVRFLDGGLISLRPGSQARVAQYFYRRSSPDQSRIEIELNQGVMRSSTGEAGQQNKNGFRVNTPVAAIGIRGTDFVVFADESRARLAVNAGGVVMSPFDDSCSRNSLAPCTSDTAAELFADNERQFLEVIRDEKRAKITSEGPSPDEISPPHPEESDYFHAPGVLMDNVSVNNRGQSAAGAASYEEGLERAERYLGENSLAGEAFLLGQQESDAPFPNDRELIAEPDIIWGGRWGGIQAVTSGAGAREWTLLNTNRLFGLLERRDADRRVPANGRATFQLDAYEAYVTRENQPLEVAGISNPALVIDFDHDRFATSFNVHAESLQNGHVPVRGGGDLTDEGFLYSDGDSPALINGVITADALQAGYLFSLQVEPGVGIEGATRWLNSEQVAEHP